MNQSFFCKKNLFIGSLGSIILFIVFFYIYNTLWNTISEFIGVSGIITDFISSRFLRNIFFAIILGATPLISFLISKYLRIKCFILVPIILILIEFLVAFIRLEIIKRNIIFQGVIDTSISFEEIRIEEFLFFGLVLGCLFLLFFFKKR